MLPDALIQPLFELVQFLVKQPDMLLALAQNVGGARDVKKRFNIRQRLGRADTHEEVRIRRFVIRRIQANFDAVRSSVAVKREGLHPVLKQDGNVREKLPQRRVELLEIEFVNVIRVGTIQSSGIRIVKPVGSRNQKQPAGGKHAPALAQQFVPGSQVLDYLECSDQIEGALRKR